MASSACRICRYSVWPANSRQRLKLREQARVARIADELAADALKIPRQFLRAVGGTVVQNNHPVRAERLPRDGFQRLREERLAVEDRNGRDDFGFHGRAALSRLRAGRR